MCFIMCTGSIGHSMSASLGDTAQDFAERVGHAAVGGRATRARGGD